MDNSKRYITQINGSELRDLFAAASPVPGFGIRIEKSNGVLKISIDENALKLAINGFYRNGGCGASAENCVDVSFTPPS